MTATKRGAGVSHLQLFNTRCAELTAADFAYVPRIDGVYYHH